MLTVGQMVEAKLKIPGAASAKGVSQLLALYSMEVAGIIRDLGIWDAEVLELRAGFDDCGRGCYHDDDCNEWLVESDAERVRVIVLKEEG